MGSSPISFQLPKLNTQNLSNLGEIAKPAPKAEALQVGKGFSTKDTFDAAPQRAMAKPAEAAQATVGTAGKDATVGTAGKNAAVGTAATVGTAGKNAAVGTAGAEGAGGDLASQLEGIIKQLQELLGQLTQLLQGLGGAGGAEGAKAVGGAGGAGGKKGGMGGAEAAQAAGTMANDPRLQDAVNRIAQDPEGAKLVEAAQAQGLKIQVGNLPNGVMGQHQDGVITISPKALQNDPDLIHTMAHELGHAATRDNGNSLNEEKSVDALGQRIQQRIAPGKTYELDIGGYKGLAQDNGTRNAFAQFGINV